MSAKRYKIVTLGCRTNQYESGAYASQLGQMGYEEAGEGEIADLCIVNSCTVTAGADSDSRSAIRRLARKHPGAKIVVTGCLVENAGNDLLQIEGVTHLVRNLEKEHLLEQLFPEEEVPEFRIESFPGHTRAFVKVQDGCNSFCTYCIIPYVRGRSRSRRVEEILSEVEGLVASGYQEVVITGINVGDFDGAPKEGEEPVRLAELVRLIDAVPGVKRLRISSIDPDEVDEELEQAVLGGRSCCPSMHIVLQSGSNRILKRMNRKYTRQIFLQTVERLRAAQPDFTCTTDVIVGFPGETEADFLETLELIEQLKFAKVHMFPYSERPRTRAALYSDKVPSDVMAERKARLLKAAERAAFALREEYVGRVASVLLEGEDGHRPGCFTGYTENFLQVSVSGEALATNQIVRVLLEENRPDGLLGKVCSN